MKKIIIAVLLVLVLALTFVSADGDLDVTVSPSSTSGSPGDTITYTVTVENIGTDTIDTVEFTLPDFSDSDSNTLTSPSISDISDLAAGESNEFTFDLSITSTPAGDYTAASFVAEDTTDATNTYSESLTITVSSVDDMSLSISEISSSLQPGENEEISFTVTNEGTETLSGISFAFESDDGDENEILDNDDDPIEVTITDDDSDNTLAPGESLTVTVEFDVDKDMDVENDYDGVITVSATQVDDQEIQVSIDITAAICEEGIQGNDLEIDIKEPDGGDNFSPGETIEVEVEVRNEGNDDLDVVIEIILFDEDDGDELEKVKKEISIDEDEEETVTIEIKIPVDIDEDHDIKIYAQVHEDGNEDDECNYDRISIDIDRDSEDAKITEVSVTPETGLTCEEEYRISVEVESVGSKDIEDLYVELLDGDLELTKSSNTFDLGDYNDDDNDERLTFDLVVPEGLDAGDYYVEIILYDDNGKELDNELLLVELDACGETSEEEDSEKTLRVTLSDEYKVDGDELTIALIIENIDDEAHQISVDVEEVSWAELDDSEYLSSLNPGDSIHAYLYFTLDLEVEGEHSMQITVSDEDGNEVSEIVTVDFGTLEITEEEDEFFSKISNWFNARSATKVTFWILADIVLIILALVFVRMLFTKR
jgi:hypothetical protein